MFKKYLVLSLLLLVVPACRNSRFGRRQTVWGTPVETVVQAPMETTPITEEVEPLVLEEDENPFNPKAQANVQEGDEIALENTDNQPGDLYADSAKYGLKSMYYDFDHHEVRKDQKEALKHNLEVAQNLVKKGFNVTIEGHACNSAGNKDYNIMISEKRAQGVKSYLMANGIDEKNIRTVGWGYERPVVAFGNAEQQSPNRRVELYAYPAKSANA